MKQEKLMDALEYIDDALLESAAGSMVKKKQHFPWKRIAALAACVSLVIALGLYNHAIMTVPKYEDAAFTAEQISALFSEKKDGINAYTIEGYPNESLFTLPQIPTREYLDVYRYNGTQPNAEELKKLMEDVLPKVEQMYGIEIPDVGITEDWEPLAQKYSYFAETAVGGKMVRGNSAWNMLSVSWMNEQLQPLIVNGVMLEANSMETDERIMERVSAVIPYLEQMLGLELSAYKIDRYRSSYDSDLYGMEIWLYAQTQVADTMLEQYGGEPSRYCDGDMIVLEFGRKELSQASDTVVCRQIRYVRSLRHRHETDARCRMISLAEAEAMLRNGYVFSNHSCRLCMQNQQKVDFTDYDRVSLEYVFASDDIRGYGIPFYTFYKRIRVNENGFVQYAKTMVPAIEVSGLEAYFEEQVQHHPE